MVLKVGDPIFRRHDARPGIVEEQDPNNLKLKVNRDHDVVESQSRHGYLKGLEPKVRQKFLIIIRLIFEYFLLFFHPPLVLD